MPRRRKLLIGTALAIGGLGCTTNEPFAPIRHSPRRFLTRQRYVRHWRGRASASRSRSLRET